MVRLRPINGQPEINHRQRKWHKKKIVLISLLSIIVLAFIVCLAISIYVGLSLTKPERKPIALTPADYGIDYQDVQFVSLDHKTNLSGWVLEPKKDTKMTIIFAHGYRGNRYEEHIPFLEIAEQLLDNGYRVLMFDFRNSGQSEGEMTTVGVKEKLDLLGAIEWTDSHYDEPIGLFGISMGAATSILAAAESKKVHVVVADSPFSDLEQYLQENLPVWTDLPHFPFTPLILTIIPMIADVDLKEASPKNVLNQVAPRPVLFIHNIGDDSIPYKESEMMAMMNPDSFSLWLTEGEGHVMSYKQNSKEYMERVNEFFERVMNSKD